MAIDIIKSLTGYLPTTVIISFINPTTYESVSTKYRPRKCTHVCLWQPRSNHTAPAPYKMPSASDGQPAAVRLSSPPAVEAVESNRKVVHC